MKVLFLNPSKSGQGNIPLNIPLLIGVLKKYRHEVRLFDMTDYEIFNDKLYEEMFFKKAAFEAKYVLKKSDYRLDFEKLLNDFKPDIIAVNCLSVDAKFTCEFLSMFKEKYKIPVLFGGIHAILVPEELLSSQACDFVCIGEGENSIIELLDAIKNNKALETVKGIWFKKDSEIIKNMPIPLTDLATLPVPDFECFNPIHFYRPLGGKGYKMLNYELSRGCLFNCTYCVNGVLKDKYRGLGNYHRIKKVSQSIEELKFLINKYNFNFIRFWDEDFTSLDSAYLEEYMKSYLKEINLPFLIYARTDTVAEKKVLILKKMGCKTFAMGIESGNEFIRKHVMNRRISNRDIIEKFNLVKSYGIRTSAYNIIGLPHETREYIFDTIELNRKVNPDGFSVTLLEPYKGIPIRKMCEDQGLDPNHEITFDKPQFIPKGMTPEEMGGLFRTFAFYVRFPKKNYDEIKFAETDDEAYQKLQKKYIEEYLTKI